jgi:RimJ/RimL family protein N-acetyltransferase
MDCFDLQPTLEGSLISLRPLNSNDFESLYEVASDPLIWKQHPYSDRYKRDVFEKFFSEALGSKGALAVIDLKNGKIIGSSRYYEIDLCKNEVYIGYTFLKREYWGGIYNAELKRLMIAHASKYVSSIRFHIDKTNIRSQRATQKIGGVLIQEIEKARPGIGTRTVLIFEIPKLSAPAQAQR